MDLGREPLLREVAVTGGRATRIWQGQLNTAGVGIEIAEVALDQNRHPLACGRSGSRVSEITAVSSGSGPGQAAVALRERFTQRMHEDVVDRLLRRIDAAARASRALREILDRADASDSAKVDQIVAYVEGEGLRAPRVPVEPAVGRDDIHLVCYQAVSA